jgi:large subunit ribosomal protein L23
MNIIPVLTEKSMKEAKKGFYTFWVDNKLTKGQLKKLIGEAFDVHVTEIRTLNYKKEIKRNYRGKTQTKGAVKKAMVALREKEKIALFEEKGK